MLPISGIKLLQIGTPIQLPYELKVISDSAAIMMAIAQFQPDVIMTTSFIPGVMNGSTFELRKRWIHVPADTKPEDAMRAVENCYSYNLWTEHQYQATNPLISVYTGTYNTGDYLRETYQSLKEQSYPTWEWVVIDDHSTDGTWERLEKLAEEDVRVRPYRSGKRLEKIGAVKEMATRLCRGAYLVELDHDDLLADFALAEIKNAFESDPKIGFVYSNSINFFENGEFHRFGKDGFWDNRYREIEYRGKKYLECLQPDAWGRFDNHPLSQWFTYLTVGPNHVRAYRKTFFDELGGYNPNLPVADDLDLFLRAFLSSVPPELEGKLSAWKCHLIDKPAYKYRYKDGYGNTTFKRNKSIQDHVQLVRQNYFTRINEMNDRRLATAGSESAINDKPCFVVASRTEEDAGKVRSALAGKDVFVQVGAKSILEAYEAGRVRWNGRRRIIYVHDDVVFNDLAQFMKVVAQLPPGLHGPCGSQASNALETGPWWEHKPLAGAYVQMFKDGTPPKAVHFQNDATEVTWLDGFCLVAIDQKWSWKVSGNPEVWHGYDWLACKRTKLGGAKCFTLEQTGVPLLGHEGYMRMEGLEPAMRTLRILSRTASERRDYPNIHEHLAEIEASARGVVLELGSREGASTAALLDGVGVRGGRVFSVDIDPAFADSWKGHPLWHFTACDSCDVKRLRAEGLPEELDVLFIDSEHTYERAKRELETWAPRVKPGGVIIMHDTESFPGVKKAAQEVIAAKGWRSEFRQNCNGLAIIRMPGDPSQISYVVLEAAPTDLTLRCLKSIRKFSKGSEVILVSNGSRPAEEAIACADRMVTLDVNLGFAAGCNAGAAVATRPILCFFNNDAAFVDETPSKLLAAMSDTHPITAPYSNRAKPPQGDIARGMVPTKDAMPDMVVGLCMMIPKTIYEDLGGFDPDLLTYEDDELCRKARTKGFSTRVVGTTWVDHERHETFKKLGLDVNEIMAKNAIIYRKKNPVIRVIVIAKDEEKALPGFFKQFEPITRDWCVLDTGSKDGTMALAKSMGCRVEKGPFEDFASARNEAVLRFGSGADWIIMIDPDERLDEHTLKHMRELLYRTTDDILYSMLQAKYPDGTIRRFVSKPFMWRNGPEIKWVFKVHEKLIGSKRQGMVMNSMNTHLIELHEDGRRQAASGFYDALMKAEPYFTDPAYKQKMIEEWPILDYDRMEDPRIRPIYMGPLVSVVIPTYKRLELLSRAIASALNQDYANLEVVVVGDSCPDLAEIAQVGGPPPRVRIYNLATNHGAGGAVPRNHAIAAAGGQLIAYLDDDNAWKPDHVSSLYRAMSESGAAYAFSSMEVNGTDLKFDEPKQGGIDTSCILHKKDLVAKHGGWLDRTAANYYHDWELVSRWVQGGEKWAATKKPTLIYNSETCGQREFLEALALSKKT